MLLPRFLPRPYLPLHHGFLVIYPIYNTVFVFYIIPLRYYRSTTNNGDFRILNRIIVNDTRRSDLLKRQSETYPSLVSPRY